VNRKVIPFDAAFVEADTALRVTDKVEFAFFELQGVDVKLFIDIARIEEKSVSRDRKQRLGQLPDALDIEASRF